MIDPDNMHIFAMNQILKIQISKLSSQLSSQIYVFGI